MVARGFTAITVAGTTVVAGDVIVQSGSEPGAHAGRLGLIAACLSGCGVDVVDHVVPAVETKKSVRRG